MKTYIVSHLGQEMGPHTEAELLRMWEQKEILPIDYVFDETKQDWMLLTDAFDWAQHLTSTSIKIAKAAFDANNAEEGPPSLTKIERAKTTFTAAPVTVEKPVKTAVEKPKSKIVVKEDPPPTEVILRRPKNIPYTTQFKSGQASIDLTELAKTPGAFTIREVPGSSLRFKEALKIEIRPAIPKKLLLNVPYTTHAGQTIHVKLEAVDENKQFCPHLNGYVELSVRTETFTRVERVQILQGLGYFGFTHTRAEKISFEISSLSEIDDQESLRIETEQACFVQILPGPAQHMSVIGPTEFTAGQNIHLELQAVDQFGNFVQNFSATVDLEADKAVVAKSHNKVG